jgi:hypothetical protein
MNKNNSEQGSNLSDLITNFKLCNNKFVKSPGDDITEQMMRYALRPKDNYNESSLPNSGISFENKIDSMKKLRIEDNKQLLKKLNLDDKIKEQTFRQIMHQKRLKNLPEYEQFKDRHINIKKKLNFGIVTFLSLSIYTLMNFHDNQLKIYNNMKDFVDNKPQKFQFTNLKIPFLLFIPIVSFILYNYKNIKALEKEYNKVLQQNYFDEEITYENVKVIFQSRLI